jgi:uncharacterized protein (DUF1778 family)
MKKKQLSGSAKMKALGKKPILLWVTPEQMEQLQKAAALQMRPVSQFVAYHTLQAAVKVAAGKEKRE